MNNILISTIFIIATICLTGCKRDGDSKFSVLPDAYNGGADKNISDLSEQDVIVRVNGKPFTKKDYELNCQVYDKMLRMSHKVPLTGYNTQANEAIVKLRPHICSQMVRRELFRSYAALNAVEVPSAYISLVAKRTLQGMNRGHSDLDKVANEMGGAAGAQFKFFIESEAREMALRDVFDKNRTLVINDADVISYSNRYEQSVVIASQKNAEQKVKIEKALADLKNGMDFAEVAKLYADAATEAEAVDEAKFWDEFSKEDFAEEPEIGVWAENAQLGDISGILELDDGYAILKVVSKKNEDVDENNSNAVEPVWEFGRIHFNIYEPYPEMTHDEIVENLKDTRSKELQKRVADEIFKTAVIEWPYGTNLFENAKN